MGERESPQRPRTTEEPAPGPPKATASIFNLKNIAVLVAAVGVSALLAIFAVGGYIAPAIEQRRISQKAEASSGKVDTELENLFFYKVDPLIVNPADSNGERYLKATITLEMHGPEILEELEKRTPQIKNQINNVLSSKTIGQIQTNEDRERLLREIQNRVNGLLLSGRISNVYFEEFVYQ